MPALLRCLIVVTLTGCATGQSVDRDQFTNLDAIAAASDLIVVAQPTGPAHPSEEQPEVGTDYEVVLGVSDVLRGTVLDSVRIVWFVGADQSVMDPGEGIYFLRQGSVPGTWNLAGGSESFVKFDGESVSTEIPELAGLGVQDAIDAVVAALPG